MPSTLYWRGGAPAVAQIQTYTFGGTWEATDLVRLQIGSRLVDVVAGSTVTNTVVDNVVSAWNALTAANYPEFAEITASRSGSNLVLTAETAGVPFVCTITPLETGGGAADDQTIEGAGAATTGTAATASEGPNDASTPENYSAGALPTNGDTLIVEGASDPMLYGLDLSAVGLAALIVRNTASGFTIGLPDENTGGYFEHRERYLKIGATAVTIDAANLTRCRLNTGSGQTTLTLLNCGTSADAAIGLEAVLWVGTHASNAVRVSKGSLGIAVLAGEVATVATLDQSYSSNKETDAKVRTGSGVTLSSATIKKLGGQLTVESAVSALTQDEGGWTEVRGAATVATATIRAGTLYPSGTGTITTLVVGSGATADFSRGAAAQTVTNCSVNGSGAIRDPAARVTWTNGIDLVDTDPVTAKLTCGRNRTWTPSAI